MKGWRSGDLVCTASGFILLTAAATPWADNIVNGGGVTGFALGDSYLVYFTMVAALTLIGFGVSKTSWTSLVALLAALAVAFVLFTAGTAAHQTALRPGFGLFALATGGAFAVVAGVLNAIEREGSTF